MREIRLSGSEGGGTEINRSFLPLSNAERNIQSGIGVRLAGRHLPSRDSSKRIGRSSTQSSDSHFPRPQFWRRRC
jgi:hypothetical protein